MIVVCPACGTRYAADEAALGGGAGRRVRCASCGNSWHYTADGAAIQAAVAEATAAAASGAEPRRPALGPASPADPPRVDRPAAAPRLAATAPLQRPSVAVELPRPKRRNRLRIGAVGVVALLVIAAFVAILAGNNIISSWPVTKSALNLIAPPGRGLKVTVTPTRTPDSLVVNGSIVNGAATGRAVPKLLITLRDGNNATLASKVIPPPVANLAPGAKADFTASFEHPAITATGVAVTFESD